MRSLRVWLEASGVKEGAVFRSVDRHGNVGAALIGVDVARIAKRSAEAVEHDPALFVVHSLRAGLAATAAKAGKAAHTSMKQTGHKSVNMVNRYVRDAELFSDNAAAGLL